MRSMVWIMLISVFISCRADENWRINEDVFDLAIGIHYNSTPDSRKTGVAVLEKMINELAKNFRLAEGRVRMAIVEFGEGDQPEVLLRIQDGITEAAVQKVCDNLHGKLSNETLIEVAKKTRELVFKGADRIHVPKLVTIITSASEDDLSQDRMDSLYEEVLQSVGGTHLLGLKSFGYSPTLSEIFRMLYRRPGNMMFWDKNPLGAETVWDRVAANTRESLSTCVFQESMSKCYGTERKCVADVFFDVAYNEGVRANREQRKRVEDYCFKNGSTTPCETEKCATSTSSTKKKTRNPVSPSTPDTLKKKEESVGTDSGGGSTTGILIGVGVTIGILIPAAIILAIVLVRRRRRRKAVVLSNKSGSPHWSVTAPPDLSITPADQLVKQYAKKSKKKVAK